MHAREEALAYYPFCQDDDTLEDISTLLMENVAAVIKGGKGDPDAESKSGDGNLERPDADTEAGLFFMMYQPRYRGMAKPLEEAATKAGLHLRCINR